MSRHRKITVGIGVFCHNEEVNIEAALKSVLASKTDTAAIKEIIVVSSGSFDKTNRIIRKFTRKDRRVKLIEKPVREGKSTAINQFLTRAKAEVLMTMSGDLRLRPDTVEELALPFLSQSVGMAGARPVPTNCRFSQVGREMNLLWKLHHLVSLKHAKCGEMVAFRNVIKKIPADSAVDEANLEVLLKLIGFVVVYAPRAVVLNRVPKTFGDMIKQRRRVEAGHLWLQGKYNYTVSTMNPSQLYEAVMHLVISEPQEIWILVRLVSFEILAKFLGWFDYRVLNRNPYVWNMVSR